MLLENTRRKGTRKKIALSGFEGGNSIASVERGATPPRQCLPSRTSRRPCCSPLRGNMVARGGSCRARSMQHVFVSPAPAVASPVAAARGRVCNDTRTKKTGQESGREFRYVTGMHGEARGAGRAGRRRKRKNRARLSCGFFPRRGRARLISRGSPRPSKLGGTCCELGRFFLPSQYLACYSRRSFESIERAEEWGWYRTGAKALRTASPATLMSVSRDVAPGPRSVRVVARFIALGLAAAK